MIPYKSINIEALNELGKGTLSDHLDMEVTDIGPEHLSMKMLVTPNKHQPMGLLHGGATAALAENIGSLAGNLCAGEGKACVGLSLNCNHVRSVREGYVFATAKPDHIGRSTQIWEIEIRDEEEKLVTICRLTLAVIDKKA